MNPKAVGERTEGLILARLLESGRSVAVPFGNNQRYDLIVDEAGNLIRVQCKTGKLKNGVVVFWTCSTNGFTKQKRCYRGQADVFMVYCPDNNKYYRVPVESAGKVACYLRVEPARSTQKCKINWAKDFEF